MKILGLDPGSRRTGYGLIETRGSRLVLLDQGTISVPAKNPVPARLAALSRGIEELLASHEPEVAALETPFHGLNVKSLIVLSAARGVLLAEIAKGAIEILEYSPAEVKVAVSGSGRAPKAQVARMVGVLLGQDTASWSEDASDAVALAICCARRYRLDRLTAFQGRRK